MNIRLFTVALLASSLPLAAQAGTKKLSLDKGDFISEDYAMEEGEATVKVKLSKSGKAKLRKLHQAGN